jgi:hypothetical protein
MNAPVAGAVRWLLHLVAELLQSTPRGHQLLVRKEGLELRLEGQCLHGQIQSVALP